jgi:thiol-disulfide isomerase/thioredoxin
MSIWGSEFLRTLEMIFPKFRFGSSRIIARFSEHIPTPMFRNLANLLSQKNLLQILLWGFLNLGIGILLVSCQSKAPAENVTTAETTPFSLSDARFQRIDGTEFGLSAEQKTYTVLHFWATWCKPCLAEFPELKAALPRLQSDSVEFFLATEEDLDQIRTFEEKRNFGLEFLHLKEATLADFEVHALPTTLVLDSTGKVVYRHSGQLNWQDVTSIEDLISQQP